MHEAHIASSHTSAPDSGLLSPIGLLDSSETNDVSPSCGQSAPDSAAAHSAASVAALAEPFAATSAIADW